MCVKDTTALVPERRRAWSILQGRSPYSRETTSPRDKARYQRGEALLPSRRKGKREGGRRDDETKGERGREREGEYTMEASAVDLRVAVSGAESVETDGTGGTGSVEKRKDEDLERVEGATVEGQESHKRKREDLWKKQGEVQEMMKDSLNKSVDGESMKCMHGVYWDGRCGFCPECEKLGCRGDREKHDQMKFHLSAARIFQQPKKPSFCELLKRSFCSCCFSTKYKEVDGATIK